MEALENVLIGLGVILAFYVLISVTVIVLWIFDKNKWE